VQPPPAGLPGPADRTLPTRGPQAGEPRKAHGLMQQMRLRGIPLAPYLDQPVAAAVCRALGLDPAAEMAEGGGGGFGGGALAAGGGYGGGDDEGEGFIEEAMEGDGDEGFDD
jgi:hypothetical protein